MHQMSDLPVTSWMFLEVYSVLYKKNLTDNCLFSFLSLHIIRDHEEHLP